MIILITGAPGAGKTALGLWEAAHQAAKENRVLHVHGVEELKSDKFPCEVQVLNDPKDWMALPDGSMVFLDEAQQVFRSRPMGSPVPDFVAPLETHRHRGFDFYLTTQSPGIIDYQVRRLAGRHVHLKALPMKGRATRYEYDEPQSKPTDWRTKQQALSVALWRYPREVFGWYRSTVVITSGHRARLPRGLWIRLLMILLPLGLAIYLFLFHGSFFMTAFGGDSELQPGGGESASVSKNIGRDLDQRFAPLAMSSSRSQAGFGVPEKDRVIDWTADFLPAVEGLPWTAPAYREVYRVQDHPRPQCVIVHDDFGGVARCNCYTQQATRMRSISEQQCIGFARAGYWDPTRRPRGEVSRVRAGADASDSAATAPPSGH